MSKASIRSHSQVILMNATLLNIPKTENQKILLVNNTLIQVRLHEPYRDSQLNELLYVIIVIVFYATALMTLIITQIKRQRREGTEIDYYDEYLQRNSEVKRTCQTATNIVSRQSQNPPPALATAAFAAAAAGTLLGRTPFSAEEAENLLGDASGPGEPTESTSAEVSRGSLGLGSSAGIGSTRVMYPRDKSPMLESIPDEGTLET